jgi:hypothetical protein
VVGVNEGTGHVDLWMIGLVGFNRSEIICLGSGLMLLLNFYDFLFHFLYLLFELVLFPDLPLDLFPVLVFEHLLPSSQSLFL